MSAAASRIALYSMSWASAYDARGEVAGPLAPLQLAVERRGARMERGADAHGDAPRDPVHGRDARRMADGRLDRVDSAIKQPESAAPCDRLGQREGVRVAQRYDAVIIGGGHNGLISAAYLARAGLKTLVLERRHVLGGAAVTEELFPGFRFSVFSLRRVAAAAGDHPRARPAQARPRHPAARRHVHAAAEGDGPPAGGGDYLWRVNDHGRTIRELRRWSAIDAEAYEEYGQLMVDMARFIKPILAIVPPDPRAATRGRCCPLAGLARSLPGAARAPAGGLRPAHDDERLGLPRPVVRDGSAQGDDVGVGDHRDVPGRASRRARRTSCSTTTWARSTAPSAPGASRRAAPAVCERDRAAQRGRWAPRSGRKRRSPTSSDRGGRAAGVVLESGEEIDADVVLSVGRRAPDVPRPARAGHARADFEAEVRRFKFRGSSGKVNLALDRLPDFTACPAAGEHLRGAISIQPVDRRHGDAPTTTRSTATSAASRTST